MTKQPDLSPEVAAAALRFPSDEQEARYRILVENMTDIVYAVDDQGLLTYLSPSCERVMGYRPEAAIGQPFVAFIAPDDLPTVQAAVDRMLAGGSEDPIEFRVIDATGAIRRVRSAGSASRGPDGRRLISGVLTDVTDRWRAEEAARRDRELLEHVAGTSPIGIVVLDRDGTIIFANARAEGLLGVTADRIAGRTYNAPEWRVTDVEGDPFPDSDLPVARVIAARQPVYGVEHAIEWPSGDRVLLSVNAAPILDDAGEIVSIVTAMEDITERKKAEAALRASERRFSGAFRSSPSPMSITRLSDAGIIDVNDAMLALFGYAREEAIGRTTSELGVWADPDTGQLNRRALAAAGRIHDEELRMVARDGRILTVRYSAELVDLDGEPCILSALIDVTERKAAEEALRDNERRLRQLIDSAPFGAHLYDLQPDGRLVFAGANESATRILGVEHTQSIGRTIEEAFPPLAATSVPDAYRHVARTGEAYHDEQVAYDAGGIRGIYDIHGLQLAPGRMAAFFQDITERRRAEDAARVMAGRLGALVDGVPLPIIGLDADGRVASWNAGAERVFGWTAAEAVGQPYPIVAGDQRGEAWDHLRRTLAGERLAGEEARRTRRDGSPVDVRIWTATWPDERGVPQGAFAVLEDITKETQAAAALEASAREVHELYNRAPVGYHSLDADGVFVRVNDTGLSLLGYAREDVIGKMNFADLLDEDGARAFRANLARFKREGSVRDLEYELLRADGSRLPVLLSATAVRDAAGEFLFSNSTIWDVTERRHAEAEREALEAQLRQAQKMEAIGKLAGGVAHDFNNLLTAIAGYAELLRNSFGPGDARLDDVDQIRHASDNAAALIRQLLAFSRQQVLQPKVMDLGESVRGMERMLRRLLREDVTLETRIEADLDPVLADQSHMEQVVLNLAVNARDAMAGGGTLTIEVANAVLDRAFAETHPSVVPGRHVRMTVVDTGIGMDEETRRHVFEPFFTTKELGKGTGLGLATVYGIVKQSGGSVWAESAVDAGSRFTVYLPSHAGPRVVRADPLAPSTVAAQTGAILVVEDAADVRKYVRTVLEQRGHRVLVACHGAEALEMVRSGKGAIDVLLTDVVMPNMGGRELAQRVRAMVPGLRVVYMSGYATTLLADGALAEEAAALLPKPFTPDELDRVVQAALRRSP